MLRMRRLKDGRCALVFRGLVLLYSTIAWTTSKLLTIVRNGYQGLPSSCIHRSTRSWELPQSTRGAFYSRISCRMYVLLLLFLSQTLTILSGLPGSTTCSIQGRLRYCANPGWKCCNAEDSAPISATCCPNGSYASQGTYCCVEGGSCTNGRTCRDCTPVGGIAASLPAVPSLPVTTPAPVSTRVAPPSFTYFTFTIT
jgi:hypothetical protein